MREKIVKILTIIGVFIAGSACLANAGTKTWTFDTASDYTAYKGSGALDPANEEIKVTGGKAELSPLDKKRTQEDTDFDSGTRSNAELVTEDYLHIVPSKIATATASNPATGYYTSPKLTNGGTVTWQTISWQEGQYPSYGGENGLVGLWRMNEGTGSDVSNRLYTDGTTKGTLTGGTWAAGRFGGGISFNGTTYVDMGDVLDQGGDFTVEAWVMRGATGSAQTIASKWDNTAPSRSWQLEFDSSNKLEFWIDQDNTGTKQNLITSTAAYTDTTGWYHIMAVYDYVASGTSKMDIYVNGDKAATQISNANGPVFNSTASLRIGNRANGDQFFNGTIDEVAIYSRALSDGEAYNHFKTSPNYIKAVLSSVDIQVRYATFGDALCNTPSAWSSWFPNPTNNTFSVSARCLQYQVKFISEDPKYNPELEKMTITHSGGSYTHDNAADFTGEFMDTVSDPAEATESSESGSRKKVKILSVFDTASYDGSIPGITGTVPNITINTSTAPYNGTFTFDKFIISAGHTVTVTGGNPLTILAYSDVTINGILNGSGTFAVGTTEGAGGPGGGKGGKGGSTDGTNGYDGTISGNGGGTGGATTTSNGKGGIGGTYMGNSSLVSFVGGSGGGGGGGRTTKLNGGGGGGGGGAIMISSNGIITINGRVRADGNNGADGSDDTGYYGAGGGGGGSGGGIRLDASSIVINNSNAITALKGLKGISTCGSRGCATSASDGSDGLIALYGVVSGPGTTSPAYNSFVYNSSNNITKAVIPLITSTKFYISFSMDTDIDNNSVSGMWKTIEWNDMRGGYRFQTRICSQPDCSDDTLGFRGSTSTSDYYLTLGGDALNVASPKQYLQYKGFGSGYFSSVTALYEGGPDLFTTTAPYVINNTGQDFGEITGFKDKDSNGVGTLIVTLGGDTVSGDANKTVRYQITNEAPANNKWYRWDGTNWGIAKNPNEQGFSLATDTNAIGEIDTDTTHNIAKFDDDVGAGTFYYRAFLKTNDQLYKISLGELTVNYYGRLTDGNPNNNPVVSLGIDTAGKTSTALQPVSVTFKTVSAIPGTGAIDITLPAWFSVPDITKLSSTIDGGLGGTLTTTNAGSNTVTIQTTTEIAAGATVNLKIAGVKNPTTAAITDKFAIKTKGVDTLTLDVGSAAGVEIKPDIAVTMEFTQQPACGACVVGEVFNAPPKIVLKDEHGNVCKYDTSKITLTAIRSADSTATGIPVLRNGNVNATTDGLAVSNGYATFSNVSYTGFEGIGKEIQFRADRIETVVTYNIPSIVSDSLIMQADVASQLAITSTAFTQNAGILSDVNDAKMTVQIQDKYGNPQIAGAYTITLSSDATGAYKFYSATGVEITANPKTIVIPDNEYKADFYYSAVKAEGPYKIEVTAYDQGLTLGTGEYASLNMTINPAQAAKIVIKNPPLNQPAGFEGEMNIEIQDRFGNPQPAGAYSRSVTLSSTSTGVYKFLTTGGALLADNKLTIADGAASGLFKYSDQKAGTPRVTVTTTGLLDTNSNWQDETINKKSASKLTIVKKNSSTPLISGTGSSGGEFTVKAQDEFGNDSAYVNDITVGISSLVGSVNTTTGMFSSDGGVTFSPPGATLSIPLSADPLNPNYNNAPFDYKDTIGGIPNFTAIYNTNFLANASLPVTVSGYEFTAPADGTTKGITETMAISWKRETASPFVNISYFLSGDTTFANPKPIKDFGTAGDPFSDSNLSLSGGVYTYNWTVPGDAMIGSGHKLRISDNLGTAKSDMNGTFNIGGKILIVSPKGNADPALTERWSVASPHNITWNMEGTVANVKIQYSVNGGAFTDVTGGNKVAGSGNTFSWNVLSDIPNGSTNVRIKITDFDNPDLTIGATSDAFYVTKITEDSSVTVNDRVAEGTKVTENILPIKWTSVGVDNVTLSYNSPENGWTDIITTSSTTGANTYSLWKVPDDIGDNVQLRIKSADTYAKIEGIPSADSAKFTIVGMIGNVKVNGVNGGSFDVNDTLTITWDASSSIGSAIKFYKRDSSAAADWASWTEITGLSPANDGTEQWKPSITGSIFIRAAYSGDLDGNSKPWVFSDTPQLVSIGGVFMATTPAGPIYTVGDSVTISGTKQGAAIDTVKVEVSYDNKGSWATIAPGLPIVAEAYTTSWTVPDQISNQVCIKATGVDVNGNNTTSVTTSCSLTIKGKITVTEIPGAWTVGETNRSIGWTVNKGTVPTVNIYYTSNYTTDSGSTWIKLNTSPRNSSEGSFAWAVIPDDISENVRIKVSDASTDPTRPETFDVLNASFAIRGKLDIASTSPSPLATDDWAANERNKAIKWDVTGSIGNVNIYYSTEDDSPAYSNWVLINTAASGGSGTAVNAGASSWARVTDLLKNRATPPNSTNALKGTPGDRDIGVRIKVQDADNSNVYAVLPSASTNFDVIYYQIKWVVMDTGGNEVSALSMTDAGITAPATPALLTFNYSDKDLASSANILRYYPYNADTNDTVYNTTFTQTSGDGTAYDGTYPEWRASKDETLTVYMDTAATASISNEVIIQASYNDDKDAIDISAWMTRKGSLVNNYVTNIDAVRKDKIKVMFVDGSGNSLYSTTVYANNSLNDGSAKVDSNGVFYGITYDPEEGLTTDVVYTIKAEVTYKSGLNPLVGVATFKIPAVMNYEVLIEPSYNVSNNSINASVWLSRAGGVVKEKPTSMTISVSPNSSGTSAAIGTFDTSTGVYPFEWDPSGGISTSTVYTINASIIYRSHTYSGNKTFSRSDAPSIDEISSEVDTKVAAQLVTQLAAQRSNIASDIGTKLSKQQTDISSDMTSQIGSQTSSLQSYINTKTSDISTIKDKVLSILEDTSAISEGSTTDSSSLTSSKLLNTENTVKTGQSLTVRYQSDAGLVPFLSVYNSSNSLVLSNARMSGVSTYGTTAIYEYKLTVDSSWGTGDFTITSSNGKGNMDSMVISVVSTDIDTLKADIKKLDDKVSGLNSTSGMIGTMNSMSKDLASLIETIASMEEDINSLEEDIKKDDSDSLEAGALPADNTAMLKTMYSTLATISTTLKENKDESMSAINDLYELSEGSAGDIEYLKEKALELKTILDMNQNMLDSVVNKPTIKTWFERE